MIQPREPSMPSQPGFDDAYFQGRLAVMRRSIHPDEFDQLRRRGLFKARWAQGWLAAAMVLLLGAFELQMAFGLVALWFTLPIVAVSLSLLIGVVIPAHREAKRIWRIPADADVALFRVGHQHQLDVWLTVPGGAVVQSQDPETCRYGKLRYAAPMPESVRLQIEEQLRDGGTEGTRKLTESERAELQRRRAPRTEDEHVFILVVLLAPLQTLVMTKSWIAGVAALVLVTLLLVASERRRRKQYISHTEVRIVADANVLGSKARWVEYLGDDVKRPWTMNGRPAWWRIE